MNRTILGIRARTWTFSIAFVVAAALIGSTVGFRDHALAQSPNNQQQAAATTPSGAVHIAKALSQAFHEASQKALPSVVMIKHQIGAEPAAEANDKSEEEGEVSPFDDMPNIPKDFRKFFKDMPRMPRHGVPGGPHGESIGSGVIIDASGIIITNNHVVEGGGKVVVRLHNGREFEASDIKCDPKTDLAVVRIKDADGLVAAKFSNSDEVQVGDWVLALGDPFGLEGTVTAGIVSAKGRGPRIAFREDFIQTDAAINPGNSGGPLVDLEGNIVGINTAISSHSGGNQGVGFAIASNMVKWVTQNLIENGSVRRGYLGVVIMPANDEHAKQFGVQTRQGVVVMETLAKSPAAEVNLKPGDVIVEYAGKPINSAVELTQTVDRSPVDSKQPIVVLRDGKKVTLEVTIREQPADYGFAQGQLESPKEKETARHSKLGIDVSPLTAEVAEKLGIDQKDGVVVTNIRQGSPAAMAGLETGSVITEVNRKPVKSVEEFQKAIEESSLAKGVLFLVKTDKGTRFVVITAN
jgi:serine protease Do